MEDEFDLAEQKEILDQYYHIIGLVRNLDPGEEDTDLQEVITILTSKSWDLEEKIDRAEGTWDTSWDEEE